MYVRGPGNSLPFGAALLALLALAGAPLRADVVISELMYHPVSDDDREEFVELFNTGASAVDLGGWRLDGVGLDFPPGATIDAGGYLVLAKDATYFQSRYGFAPALTYSGQLSNDGETLTLRDGAAQIVDEVSYDDVPDWPTRVDGDGPSLELIDPAQPHDTPRNWAACIAGAGHTAGQPNSVAAVGLPPWISEVSYSRPIPAGSPLNVSARVDDASAASLTYRIDFGAETTLAMLDDGASNDGAAGDGVFGAQIPAQASWALIRFRIEAVGPTGAMRHPRVDDSQNYVGTVSAGLPINTPLPILHWYVDPLDYQHAIEHRFTDDTEPCVLYYDGVLYDNVRFRARGQTSRSWSKLQWKFQLPRGHKFDHPDLLSIAVKEFDLQSGWSDKTYMREMLASETFRDAGLTFNTTRHAHVRVNGVFRGLYMFREAMEDEYLERQGVDKDGAWYKCYEDGRARPLGELPAHYQKMTRKLEGFEDLQALLDGVNNLGGQARRDFLFDNLNVPAMLNYIAAKSVIHDNDHVAKNYFLYRDTNVTGRWTMHNWDVDLTFGRNFNAGGVLNDTIWADVDAIQNRTNVSPSHPLFGDSEHQKYDFLWNRIIDAVLEQPELREMYHRRLRTLIDKLLADGRYEARIDELAALIGADAAADKLAWGQYGTAQTLETAVTAMKDEYLTPRRTHLRVTHRVPGEIPAAQSPNPAVVINEIHYHPLGATPTGFVELFNPSDDESVDLSGWRLHGVDFTFPAGTVILPLGYALAVQDDVAFRAQYGPGKFVAGQFDGALDPGGENLVLRNADGDLVDSVRYDDDAPWPTAADGGGPSLELIDATRDNNRASNWAGSGVAGGTPGAANSMAGVAPDVPDVFVNEVLPVNTSVNVDEAGDHDPWVELYNGSPAAVDLGGMYLTDNLAVPTQWAIPSGVVLCPHSWLIVWLDNEPGEGPLHANFTIGPEAGTVALFTAGGVVVDALNFDALPANVSYDRFPDGTFTRRTSTTATPAAGNNVPRTALILNEYNAVDATAFLAGSGADSYFGRIVGNGGDWFELVVTQDHADIRGWQLFISDDTGGAGQTQQTLVLSQDPLWADLRAGTIITVAEDLPTDASYDPVAGDWWINVQAADAASGQYVTNANFKVTNRNWQLTIRDAQGAARFGPAGEGVAPPSGVGGDEVCRLEEDPSEFTLPTGDFDDADGSTFGAPNAWSSGTVVQDFAPLRNRLELCAGAGDCDDGDDCTLDTCVGGVCAHAAISNCYRLRLIAGAGGDVRVCPDGAVDVRIVADGLVSAIMGAHALLRYDPAHLTLTGITPGDGAGSPWDAATEELFTDSGGDVAYSLTIGTPTAQPATVATLHFVLIDAPGSSRVSFRDACVPFVTSVSRASDAMTILPVREDSGLIVRSDVAPTIIAPATLSYPSALDCSGAVLPDLVAQAVVSAEGGCPPIELTLDPPAGTLLAPGPHTVTVTATDAAGNTAQQDIAVEVATQIEFRIDVALADVSAAGITRCVEFDFWTCPGEAPAHSVSVPVTFVAGQATGVVVSAPCLAYTCVTARDPLHTLRRANGAIVPDGGQLTVAFTGAMSLVGGDLTGDGAIDGQDAAAFLAAYASNYGSGDVACGASAPQADVNGDGVVTAADYTYVQIHAGQTSDAPCCP